MTQIYKTKLFTTNFSASFFSDFHNFSNFSNFSNFIQWSFLWISWNPYTFLWKIYIFANKNKEFFEALQKKEGERHSLVSKSFTFYYSYLCFPTTRQAIVRNSWMTITKSMMHKRERSLFSLIWGLTSPAETSISIRKSRENW